MAPNGWLSTTIGDCLIESTIRNADLTFTHDDLRSVNKVLGMIPMKDRVKGESVERAKVVQKGWFAYNPMRINIGSICRWDREEPCIVSPDYVVFECDEGKLRSDYFDQFRQSHVWQSFMEDAGRGSVRIRIYLDDLRQLKCILPPLNEQQQIAEILAAWDAAIATASNLVDNAATMKRGLMQELLGKRATKSDPKKLRDLCTVRRGASPRPIADQKWFAERGRGWVRIADVTRSPGRLLQRTEQYLSDAGSSASVAVDPGELIMSICATIGVPKFIDIPVCIHDGFVVFKDVSPDLHLPFLYYVLENATARLTNSGQPGTQKNINTTIVGDIDVPDLPFEEQKAIAGMLADADDMHCLTSQRLENLQKEREALRQQLLTGKRRVSTKKEAA